MDYGKNLINIRERIGLSQIQVAKILNISNSLYARYEKELQIIPIKHLNTLCNYYNLSFDKMFNFTNINNYKNIKKDINKIIAGERLKNFRKENKLTQVNLAELLNTTHSVIAAYESGKTLITTSFLYAICKKYNISADYLLGRTNTPKYLKTK